MSQILRFFGSFKRDPAITTWMDEHSGELGAMRHVKLRPGCDIDATALVRLIESAYSNMKQQLETES